MRKIFLLTILIGVAVVLSCSKSSSTGPEMARLQVYLQDSPIAFDSVFVTIKQIAIRSTMQYDDSSKGWNILFDVPEAFDLVKLHNGHRHLLFNRNIPVGTYEPLRIILGSSMAMKNDTVYGLNYVHESDTLIYSNGYIEVAKDKTAQTLVDFDLFSSINYSADSSRYYFEPQFTFIDIDSTGDMHGKIIPAATVYLINDNDTLTYTFTEPITNNFGFYGLRQGIYNIGIVPRDTAFESLTEENIPVEVGADYDFGTIELIHH
jgi:hypothetical protein